MKKFYKIILVFALILNILLSGCFIACKKIPQKPIEPIPTDTPFDMSASGTNGQEDWSKLKIDLGNPETVDNGYN